MTFGHGRLGEREEQLRAVLDDAAVLLVGARAGSPGTSTKVTSGMLKQSQKRTKRAAFIDASMSSTPASTAGWFATTPTARPPMRAKPTTMFCAYGLGDLEEVPVVDDGADDVLHVVRLVRLERDHRVELGHLAESAGPASA